MSGKAESIPWSASPNWTSRRPGVSMTYLHSQPSHLYRSLRRETPWMLAAVLGLVVPGGDQGLLAEDDTIFVATDNLYDIRLLQGLV
jgi:hypothetical protein